MRICFVTFGCRLNRAESLDLGRSVYAGYVQLMMKQHFAQMFEVLDQIPRESIDLFAKALANPLGIGDETPCADQPVLIPCRLQER